MLQSRLLVQQLVRRVMIFVGLGKQSPAKGKGKGRGADKNHDVVPSIEDGSEVVIVIVIVIVIAT